jgi:hypothetical protein
LKENLNSIKMSFHIKGGKSGIDDDPNNPISRASRHLLDDGTPYKKMSLCFYRKSEGEQKKKDSTLKWFGAFVISHAERLIFSPGFALYPMLIKETKNNFPVKSHEIPIDHITLEKNLLKWHLTNLGSTYHLGHGRTIELGEERFLWFGMSIANSDVLKDVRDETVYQVFVPPSDAKRRMDVLMNSRDGVIYNIILLPPQTKQLVNMNFIHFVVIVGKKGFSNYIGSALSAPYGSPFVLNEPRIPLTDIPLRSHRLSLNATVEIQIIALCLPGQLTERVVFTGKTPI